LSHNNREAKLNGNNNRSTIKLESNDKKLILRLLDGIVLQEEKTAKGLWTCWEWFSRKKRKMVKANQITWDMATLKVTLT